MLKYKFIKKYMKINIELCTFVRGDDGAYENIKGFNHDSV